VAGSGTQGGSGSSMAKGDAWFVDTRMKGSETSINLVRAGMRSSLPFCCPLRCLWNALMIVFDPQPKKLVAVRILSAQQLMVNDAL